ncbi:hypothetical protein M404DRAFT_491764 [Pisolithus tinctorius Marx 270]|uniref:Uncharacterized protein n=1 Tax=Pisolithus tinctorius Marx 270 TaxID=870435 RepID=A0A0C3K8Y1_PISTI|nr:hypothetical protein M404DRAFT_491764 [Pisolithus tinctorius Marx 270]
MIHSKSMYLTALYISTVERAKGKARCGEAGAESTKKILILSRRCRERRKTKVIESNQDKDVRYKSQIHSPRFSMGRCTD